MWPQPPFPRMVLQAGPSFDQGSKPLVSLYQPVIRLMPPMTRGVAGTWKRTGAHVSWRLRSLRIGLPMKKREGDLIELPPPMPSIAPRLLSMATERGREVRDTCLGHPRSPRRFMCFTCFVSLSSRHSAVSIIVPT